MEVTRTTADMMQTRKNAEKSKDEVANIEKKSTEEKTKVDQLQESNSTRQAEEAAVAKRVEETNRTNSKNSLLGSKIDVFV